MRILEDGCYTISGPIDVPGEGVQDFVFARGWLLEVVEIISGEYYFISDGQPVQFASRRFGVFYPPFTFVRAFTRDFKGFNLGIGSERTPPELPDHPFVFQTDRSDEFSNIDQALELLDRCDDRTPIQVNTAPSLLSVKTKRLIDENYLIYPSISRIAKRLKVSHAHVSRQFKKDFGSSPSRYLHNLRVAEATFRLSRGEEIIEISQDVGYNDLSRFYQQFRKSTKTSPAACRQTLTK